MKLLSAVIYKTKLYYLIDYIDYCFCLNLFKHLPVRIAENMAALRGTARYFLDLDWRSSCLGYPFVRERTSKAFSALQSSTEPERKVMDRFICQSREELEAKLFSVDAKKWPCQVTYDNLDFLNSVQKEGRGVIFLTAHFDSSVAGSTFLGNLGHDVNIFYDEIVYDKRVPFFFRSFFRTKYTEMQNHYNKGIFISKRNLKDIYRRLEKGEVFIWLSDVLNINGNLEVNFLNRRYKVADNILRIALKTRSYVAAYVTLWEGNGCYRTIISRPVLPSKADNPENVIQECYDFLSEFILAKPERWWVADTFLEFKEK